MVKYGEDAMDNIDKLNNNIDNKNDYINNDNELNQFKAYYKKNNLTIDDEMRDKNFISRSKAIVKLKNSSNNQYNKLFFNKTLTNTNRNNINDKGIILRTDKINSLLNKNPIKIQKEII